MASVLGPQLAGMPVPDHSSRFLQGAVVFAHSSSINVNGEAMLANLRDFRRVLKSGGSFVNLKTSQPPGRLVRALFHLHAQLAVEHLGKTISGSPAGYPYLSPTLVRFCGAEELVSIMPEAGFSRVSFRRSACEVVAVHEAAK